MRRPEVSSLRLLTPLPRTLWQSNCAVCDKTQARWTVRGVQPAVFICSLCLLYRTTWGKQNAAQVESIKAEVEKSRTEPFQMQGEKLHNCADADSVLGVVVLIERTLSRMPQ